MPIGLTSVTSGSNTTGGTTQATASITPATGHLLVVWIKTAGIESDTNNTVTGLSGTWTNPQHAYEGSALNQSQLSVHFCTNYTGTGTLTLGNTTNATHYLWSVFLCTGVNLTTPMVASSWKVATNALVNSQSITLNAPAKSNNRPFSAFHTDNSTAGQTAPQTNWTEIHDVGIGTPTATFETQWRSDTFDTAALATYTGGPYTSAGAAFEMNALDTVDVFTHDTAINRSFYW